MKSIYFIRKISLISACVLILMMLCPVLAAAQKANLRSHSHCDSEAPAHEERVMQCCCGQQGIMVQALHAPFELLELLPASKSAAGPRFVFECDPRPYLKTSDHLSELSTLRL